MGGAEIKVVKVAEQLTLDNLQSAQSKKPDKNLPQVKEKKIEITEINAHTKEDELALKVSFKLYPSKTSFSKVQLDLWFDNQRINSVSIKILQGPLATDEFELTTVLNMKGIPAGSYRIRVEMYELWSGGEKFSQVFKDVTLDYVPITRESRLVRVPSVKCVAGADLVVVSESEKDVYRGIEKIIKKEELSKRDNW